jgi:hypothetical protein
VGVEMDGGGGAHGWLGLCQPKGTVQFGFTRQRRIFRASVRG